MQYVQYALPSPHPRLASPLLPSHPYLFLLGPSLHCMHSIQNTQPSDTAANFRAVSPAVQQSVWRHFSFRPGGALPWDVCCNSWGLHSPPGTLFLMALPDCPAQPSTPPQTHIAPRSPPHHWFASGHFVSVNIHLSHGVGWGVQREWGNKVWLLRCALSETGFHGTRGELSGWGGWGLWAHWVTVAGCVLSGVGAFPWLF